MQTVNRDQYDVAPLGLCANRTVVKDCLSLKKVIGFLVGMGILENVIGRSGEYSGQLNGDPPENRQTPVSSCKKWIDEMTALADESYLCRAEDSVVRCPGSSDRSTSSQALQRTLRSRLTFAS